MFLLIARNKEDQKFSVLDTKDFVVEVVDLSMIKECIAKGIEIRGIRKADKVWDYSICRGKLPENLMDRIMTFVESELKNGNATDEEVEVAKSTIIQSFLSKQKSGLCLANVAKNLSKKQLEVIYSQELR